MATNWSQDAEIIIASVLGEVPEVGSLLSGLVEILWPQSNEDVWSEIESEVEALINQAISQEVYGQVQAALGSSSEGTGLIGVISNYIGAVNNTNGQNVQDTWTSANSNFISYSGTFQQTGYEVLLLPLFAQMANLHLTLLRDGVQLAFCNDDELQNRIATYQAWANQWSATAIKNASQQYGSAFNPVNQVIRFMQLNVSNFSRLWPYFDASAYPPPVQDIPIGPEIFYTVTECAPSDWGVQSPAYSPPGAQAGNLNEVGIYSCASDEGDWIMLAGADSNYDSSGSTGYSGVTLNNGVPPINQYIYDVGTYSLTQKSIDPSNPVTSIYGNYSADCYVRFIQFIFQDNRYTTYIPYTIDNCSDSNVDFTIGPPAGYYLSSVWLPPNAGFYTAAFDVVFGFQSNGRLPDIAPPYQAITFDPQAWIADCPVAGSSNWVVGYSVQYALVWIYADGTTSALTAWCPPIQGGPWAMPTLLLPTTTDPNAVGRQVWRQFAGGDPECVGKLDDVSTVRFADTTP